MKLDVEGMVSARQERRFLNVTAEFCALSRVAAEWTGLAVPSDEETEQWVRATLAAHDAPLTKTELRNWLAKVARRALEILGEQ